MEANEAPKKIYLTKSLLGELHDSWNAQPSEVFTNFEYIRTDAFIEKALEWVRKEIRPYYSDVKYKYEDFKKYMSEAY